MTETLRKLHPGIVRVILDERDDVLCRSLLERCEGPRVVGVVGLAHVNGIEQRWNDALGRSDRKKGDSDDSGSDAGGGGGAAATASAAGATTTGG